jgi:hypothetical protein
MDENRRDFKISQLFMDLKKGPVLHWQRKGRRFDPDSLHQNQA